METGGSLLCPYHPVSNCYSALILRPEFPKIILQSCLLPVRSSTKISLEFHNFPTRSDPLWFDPYNAINKWKWNFVPRRRSVPNCLHVALRDVTYWCSRLLRQALRPKACCGLAFFSRDVHVFLFSKVNNPHLFGNHTYSEALYVGFPVLSVFVNSVILTCHVLFIPQCYHFKFRLLLFLSLGSGIA